MDSVPPSIDHIKNGELGRKGTKLTSEGGRHKDAGEATDPANERGIADKPVVAPNVAVLGVGTTIYGDS